MKRIFILFTLASAPLCALDDHTSVSFMFPHPATHNLAMYQSGWHVFAHAKEGEALAAVQVIPFLQRSVKEDCTVPAQSKLAGYFFPECKNQLSVRGDAVTFNSQRDIRAEWLGLPTNFSGIMSINPEQEIQGVIIDYNQDIKKFVTGSFFDHLWFAITLPIVSVKNDIHLEQSALGTLGTTPKDIIEAFDQATWKFGKLKNCQKKTGIAEIKFKLGATFYAKKDYEVSFYSLLSIPTSSRHDPAYIFSPFIGNDHHVALGTGANFQFPVTSRDDEWPLLFFATIEHQYLWWNSQYRTFDLRGKPWSRYLLFNSSDSSRTNVPGVNVLTRRVKAKPDSFVDLSTGFRLPAKEWLELEVGYNLWAHGNERLELIRTVCDDCNRDINLEEFGIAGTAAGKSASNSTIKIKASDDSSFVKIIEQDLDLDSAAARSTITHKIHGGLTISSKHNSMGGLINIGAFYEIPQNNAALTQWGIWAKAAASF